MSYSISASGHITDQEAEIEAELAVKLHELLSQPKYGCSIASLGGQHVGYVDLLESNEPQPGAEEAPGT